MTVGFFDPNTWADPEPYEFRVYGDDRAQTWAVVDEIDYQFVIQWRWRILPSSTKHRKLYMVRKGHVGTRAKRKQPTIFLHHVILQRAGIKRPSLFHVADHEDGDSLNCRRENLRWLTITENNTINRNDCVYDPNGFLEGFMGPEPLPAKHLTTGDIRLLQPYARRNILEVSGGTVA